MKYYTEKGVHIVECVPSELSVKIVSAAKKNIKHDTYANGGFFWYFTRNAERVTYPLAHVKGDVESINEETRKELLSIGSIVGNKYTHDNGAKPNSKDFAGKKISTLYISGGKAFVGDLLTLPTCDYAISGVPVIRGGEDVTWKTYVSAQGWGADTVRATWHTLIGLKGDGKIYLMSWQSKTSNLIYGMEAYKLFKPMGFVELLKLDGGGSHHLCVNGAVKSTTSENRVVNNIIVIEPQKSTAPTPPTTKTAWEKATAKGIFDGTRAKDALTREEAAIVLERLGLV